MQARYLPTSKRVVTSVEPMYRVAVLSQEGTEVILRNSVNLPLVVGQRVLFEEGVAGLVMEVLETSTRVRLAEDRRVTTAYLERGLLYPEPQGVTLYGDPLELGQLSAFCRNTGTPKAGLLGWSLYRDGQKLLEGCDYFRRDHCHYSGSGLWAPGKYLLKVTAFYTPAQPLKAGSRGWYVETATSSLYAGQYVDKLGPIFLT